MTDAGSPDGAPDGDVYEWYRRGLDLLASGDPAAAATLLARAVASEPASRSLREALGRAQYDAAWYEEAIATFSGLIAEDPADDYAQFALGMAASRSGQLTRAAEHLALAAAMRPDLGHYGRALRNVRARRASESA